MMKIKPIPESFDNAEFAKISIERIAIGLAVPKWFWGEAWRRKTHESESLSAWGWRIDKQLENPKIRWEYQKATFIALLKWFKPTAP